MAWVLSFRIVVMFQLSTHNLLGKLGRSLTRILGTASSKGSWPGVKLLGEGQCWNKDLGTASSKGNQLPRCNKTKAGRPFGHGLEEFCDPVSGDPDSLSFIKFPPIRKHQLLCGISKEEASSSSLLSRKNGARSEAFSEQKIRRREFVNLKMELPGQSNTIYCQFSVSPPSDEVTIQEMKLWIHDNYKIPVEMISLHRCASLRALPDHLSLRQLNIRKTDILVMMLHIDEPVPFRRIRRARWSDWSFGGESGDNETHFSEDHNYISVGGDSAFGVANRYTEVNAYRSYISYGEETFDFGVADPPFGGDDHPPGDDDVTPYINHLRISDIHYTPTIVNIVSEVGGGYIDTLKITSDDTVGSLMDRILHGPKGPGIIGGGHVLTYNGEDLLDYSLPLLPMITTDSTILRWPTSTRG